MGNTLQTVRTRSADIAIIEQYYVDGLMNTIEKEIEAISILDDVLELEFQCLNYLSTLSDNQQLRIVDQVESALFAKEYKVVQDADTHLLTITWEVL